ncbi:hypothetical protein [Sorangium sp. So ce861]|uniref:hypothetical protein n=1 Tax=Sorangium sp. So ce861 TaxID=3133323 RepID=UPI003F5EA3AE
MSVVEKLEGTTPSERYLKALCERSFLSLWSYPNVYRDQGKRGHKGIGKEVCDLLVVFGNDVIIFSDKSCAFPDTGNVEVDWRRWYKRSIEKSADQVYGAERWIREYPERLFLDPQCTQRFPLNIGSPSEIRFHRIVVALGAGERCRKHHDGGSGSLMLAPEVSPPTAANMCQLPSVPFVVGRMPKGEGFVHVFDDVSLDIVMRELDTVSDFVAYLNDKEGFVLSGRLIMSLGEENLLASYLVNWDEHGRHYFPTAPDNRALILGEDLWDGLSVDPRYQKFKNENHASYLWDKVIETFNRDILAGRMVRGNEHGVAGHEKRVRALARPTRFVRTQLALALGHLFQNAPPDMTSFRSVVPDAQPDTGYIFLLVPRGADEDFEEYRIGRGNMLMSYCMVFKSLTPGVRHVVGIATAPRSPTGEACEEVVYIDGGEWTPEDDAAAREIQKEYGILTRLTRARVSLREVTSDQGGRWPEHNERKQHCINSKQKRRATRKAQKAARKAQRASRKK